MPNSTLRRPTVMGSEQDGRSLLRELAHELRDALSPLSYSVDLARLRGFDLESSQQLAGSAERGLRRARAVLDAFLLAEQFETGRLQVSLQSTALADIVRATRERLTGPELLRCTFVADAEQAVVSADALLSAQLLRAVLQQLGTIAESGSTIEISSVVGGPRAMLRVRAHGNADNVGGEEWVGASSGGGPLDLATVRRIMELQDGDLDFVRNNGTEFEVVLRFRVDGARTRGPSPGAVIPSSPTDRNRVLIVDDNEDVRRVYREALASLGYVIVEAADPEQALEAVERDAPNVALIDIHLPRMSGFRLAQTMRGRLGDSIYLVMLSGMALDSATRNLAREAGFDECLDKMAGPLALRELIALAVTRSKRMG